MSQKKTVVPGMKSKTFFRKTFSTFFRNFRFSFYLKSAKLKAQHYKDDIISKGFYRFGYHRKICQVLHHYFNNDGRVDKDEFINKDTGPILFFGNKFDTNS